MPEKKPYEYIHDPLVDEAHDVNYLYDFISGKTTVLDRDFLRNHTTMEFRRLRLLLVEETGIKIPIKSAVMERYQLLGKIAQRADGTDNFSVAGSNQGDGTYARDLTAKTSAISRQLSS